MGAERCGEWGGGRRPRPEACLQTDGDGSSVSQKGPREFRAGYPNQTADMENSVEEERSLDRGTNSDGMLEYGILPISMNGKKYLLPHIKNSPRRG